MLSEEPISEDQPPAAGSGAPWPARWRRLLQQRAVRASLVSVSVDLLQVAIKGGLALVTGSLALAAEAFHSLTDMVVSMSVLLGLLLSRGTAAGKGGRRGIEAVVACFVAALILLIPVEILSEVRAQEQQTIRHAWAGILGMLACMAIAYFASRFKLRVGRDEASPALEADGHHSRVDVFASLAVLLSLMGQFIGIQLDAVTAVIIAVIIGLTGVELMAAALLSLARGTRLKEVDAARELRRWSDRLLGQASQTLLRRRLGLPRLRLDWLRRPRALASLGALLAAAWLATGFVVVGPGELGVERRLGTIADAAMAPGLHYHLPWPLGAVARVRPAQIRRLELGFRTDPVVGAGLTSQVWEGGGLPAGYARNPDESLMVSGDEGVVDVSLVLHYQMRDAVSHLIAVADGEAVLRALAESAARQALARLPANAAMGEGRADLLRQVQASLAADAERLGLGIGILAVHAHDIRPPEVVVPAFRDVFSARETKASLLAQAQAHRGEALPKARAEHARLLGDAGATARERRLRAEGDAAKFDQLARAYRRSAEVTGYRLFIEAVERRLAGKEKVVADPGVNRGEYRHWYFAPGQMPKIQARSSQGVQP